MFLGKTTLFLPWVACTAGPSAGLKHPRTLLCTDLSVRLLMTRTTSQIHPATLLTFLISGRNPQALEDSSSRYRGPAVKWKRVFDPQPVTTTLEHRKYQLRHRNFTRGRDTKSASHRLTACFHDRIGIVTCMCPPSGPSLANKRASKLACGRCFDASFFVARLTNHATPLRESFCSSLFKFQRRLLS